MIKLLGSQLPNALGPELDQLMPPWSYSYRIYRPAWYEDDEDNRSQLEIGPYRHESGHLYRRFQHSWPLFRRHVALTARAMVRGTPFAKDDLDEADQLAVASRPQRQVTLPASRLLGAPPRTTW